MGLTGSAGLGFLSRHATQTSPFRAPQGPGGGCRLWAAAHVYYLMKLCVVEHQMRSLLSFSSTVTYSPNTTTNKKPALGGLEKAQALRSLVMPRTMNQI